MRLGHQTSSDRGLRAFYCMRSWIFAFIQLPEKTGVQSSDRDLHVALGSARLRSHGQNGSGSNNSSSSSNDNYYSKNSDGSIFSLRVEKNPCPPSYFEFPAIINSRKLIFASFTLVERL